MPGCWILPPTSLQQRLALGLVAAVSVAFVAIIPISSHPLAQLNAFFPSLDAIVFVTDLITAFLLLAQFSISGARPLLILAAGYLFTALIVVPHALTFAGAFSPTGLLGAGIQTGSWLFIFWHFGFSLSLLIYAMLRSRTAIRPVRKTHGLDRDRLYGRSAVGSGLRFDLACDGGTDAVAAHHSGQQPNQPIVVYPIMLTITITAGALAVLLLKRRRSTLDHWLIVVAFVAIGELAFSGLIPTVRFSAGFYAGRVYSLITSSIVLIGAARGDDAALRSSRALKRDVAARAGQQADEYGGDDGIDCP